MEAVRCPEMDDYFDWDKRYPINPWEIKWGASGAHIFNPCNGAWDKVWGGDWDKKIPIENDFIYTSVMQLIRDNIPFCETPLCLASIDTIKKGVVRWNCRTPEEFLLREHRIRTTYNQIKSMGFKTQEELCMLGYNTVDVKGERIDDPGICIDRYGKYLYHNGNHRLPMFRLLNISSIKVKVNVRHSSWVEFLKYVKRVRESVWGKNKIYQPVDHIDFRDIPSEWSAYRLNLIKTHINSEVQTILDIGSLWGHFSSGLEDSGYKCTAVERNHEFALIMCKLRDARDQNFKILNCSILDIKNIEYDAVLALNIFHHFLKSKELFDQLTLLLQRIQTNEMYFQAHSIDEAQMQGAYKNYSPEEFVQYIIQNSCLTGYQEIGEELGRKIYKLTR